MRGVLGIQLAFLRLVEGRPVEQEGELGERVIPGQGAEQGIYPAEMIVGLELGGEGVGDGVGLVLGHHDHFILLREMVLRVQPLGEPQIARRDRLHRRVEGAEDRRFGIQRQHVEARRAGLSGGGQRGRGERDHAVFIRHQVEPHRGRRGEEIKRGVGRLERCYSPKWVCDFGGNRRRGLLWRGRRPSQRAAHARFIQPQEFLPLLGFLLAGGGVAHGPRIEQQPRTRQVDAGKDRSRLAL